MLTLTEKQIKDIAWELSAGVKCYVHKKTHIIESLPDFVGNGYVDTDDWDDLAAELKDNRDDYVEFEQMSSHDSFMVMEDFVEEVCDPRFRKELLYTLSGPKPFRNFKNKVEYNDEYRDSWFAFKYQKEIQWVEKQLAGYNRG